VGRGLITKELAQIAKKVIGYEMDPNLAKGIEFGVLADKVEILNEDFQKADIKQFGKVKIFANIPFFITADIVRQITLDNDNVKEAYLIMEKQAAWRFLGQPYKPNSILSILIQSQYKIKIIHNFSPTDFSPIPKADIVLLSFINSDIGIDYKLSYYDFVSFIFNERKDKVKNALLSVFTFIQVKKLAKNLGLNLGDKVSELTCDQWLSLYRFFLTQSQEKQVVVVGAYEKIMRHQKKLNTKTISVYTD
jgi:23S rRNA (adenine-N6)-dimethyltransferase